MEVLHLVSLPTNRSLTGLRSDHGEADTRIVLHARDAAIRWYQQINVICQDTDILVLLLAHQPNLFPAVWMFTRRAKRKLYVPVHQICLSEETRNSLLAFHSITGCDTTSQFAGIGKQPSWSIFVTCPRLLQRLGKDESPEEKVLCDAEAFICQLYNKGTEKTLINRERASTFRRAKKSLDSLPPSQDVLHLHIKRAHYQTFTMSCAAEPRGIWMALWRWYPEAWACNPRTGKGYWPLHIYRYYMFSQIVTNKPFYVKLLDSLDTL